MKIYKYELNNNPGITEIEMPVSEILNIQLQNGSPVIWALIRQEENIIKRKFLTVFTGEDFDHFLKPSNYYIGTYQISGFVFHVFEIQ